MTNLLCLIPGVMGMPAINESLSSLLEAMAERPANVGLDIIMSWAKMIGLCIALGVGANECFQMMLGRRGLDVMKLIHIFIISTCITFAGGIVKMAEKPGKALTSLAKAKAEGQNERVKMLEENVAKLQEYYIDNVRKHLQQLEENRKAEEQVSGTNIPVLSDIEEIGIGIKNQMKEWALLLETKICEWINLIIRYIGEILFQVAYYGLFVCQAIFLHLLGAFAPLMFAISLSPHFKSAWSQWLSKFISISLWGFITYVCIYYVGFIMEATLDKDIDAYEMLILNTQLDKTGDVNIAAIGMQSIGTTCMYVVGLLIGVRAIAFVPEVASWLIPGGVASGAGGSSASMASSAGSAAMSATTATAGAVGGVVGGAMASGASYAVKNFSSAAAAGVPSSEVSSMGPDTTGYQNWKTKNT